MASVQVILNPIAGRGAGTRLWSQIEEHLRSNGLDFDLMPTVAPGHATALARDATSEGKEAVVVVGGDGTTNEVLNGLIQGKGSFRGPVLGVLPVGTGNDFAFGADLPLDVWEACQVLTRGRIRSIDVGQVQADNDVRRYFCNGFGVGFDAICNIESRKIKRLRGFAVYLVAVLRTILSYYKAPWTKICIDGEEMAQSSLMISIMNGRRMGGGFYMTPGSQMDDGILHLCIAGEVSRLQMLALVPRFMRGTHITDSHITMTQGQEVSIVSDSPWAAQVDGEVYGVGAHCFEVKLLAQHLSLLC
jgi:YegS/Rv2252/BmrU family lipid kinase